MNLCSQARELPTWLSILCLQGLAIGIVVKHLYVMQAALVKSNLVIIINSENVRECNRVEVPIMRHINGLQVIEWLIRECFQFF